MGRKKIEKWFVTRKPSSEFQLYDFARSATQAKDMLRDLEEGKPIAHKSKSQGGLYNIYVQKGTPLWMKKGGRLTDKNDIYYLLYEYDKSGRLVANSPKSVSFESTMDDWRHLESQTDYYEVITYPSRRKKSEHPTKIELWQGERKLQEYILSEMREKGGSTYAKGGGVDDIIEIDGKKYRVRTEHRYNSDGIYEPFDIYEEVDVKAKGGSTYAEGGELDGNHYDNGGGINSYNPIKNRPVTYILKDKNGKEVFKTKSGNKASDERVTRFFKGEETSILAVDSKGNEKQLFKLQSEESGSTYAEGGEIGYYDIYDDETNKTLHIKARSLEEAEGIADTLDWDSEKDGSRIDVLDDMDSYESMDSYAEGGKVNSSKGDSGRYHILGELEGKQPTLHSSTNDKKAIASLVKQAEEDFEVLTNKKHNVFVTDSKEDREIYNYAKGGEVKSNWFSGELSFLNW